VLFDNFIKDQRQMITLSYLNLRSGLLFIPNAELYESAQADAMYDVIFDISQGDANHFEINLVNFELSTVYCNNVNPLNTRKQRCTPLRIVL
jgi:hypothetical protein